MLTLAIETSGEACSVALFKGADLIDARHDLIGRGHAERLVPMVQQLPDKGRADEIRVSLGPGSFTGIRIGLAAARAFAIAWDAEVRGYQTLSLIAAMARQEGAGEVGVCMNGGHGEWFVQSFDQDGNSNSVLASLPPLDALAHLGQHTIAGNRAVEFANMAESGVRALPIVADARLVMALPQDALTEALAPIYGRAPDARKPA